MKCYNKTFSFTHFVYQFCTVIRVFCEINNCFVSFFACGVTNLSSSFSSPMIRFHSFVNRLYHKRNITSDRMVKMFSKIVISETTLNKSNSVPLEVRIITSFNLEFIIFTRRFAHYNISSILSSNSVTKSWNILWLY